MKLKSFGCSFIFGSELSDNGRNGLYPIFSQLTWPALLARHLNRDYHSYAAPGSGNLRILERLLVQATRASANELFVVGWTWVDRFDYYTSDPTNKMHPWATIRPSDTTEMSKVYYRDMHSEYFDKFTSLSYIKLAIDTLKQKNIPFIMTYIDELMFDQQWNTSPAVKYLQEYVRPYMTTFDGQNFLDWSRKNGYPETESWHPLEAAHQGAAEYMIKVFDKQKTNDQAQ